MMNALTCALEILDRMKTISKEWQIKKNWDHELYLSIGLDGGREWLGTFETPTGADVTVLGDIVNHAEKISDFSKSGEIWATKKLLSNMPDKTYRRVKYGIFRITRNIHTFVARSFQQMSDLADLQLEQNVELKNIADLPITQIIEVADANTLPPNAKRRKSRPRRLVNKHPSRIPAH
jgi:class 3 adenylate cyclase